MCQSVRVFHVNPPEFSQLQDRHKYYSFSAREVRLGVIRELVQGYVHKSTAELGCKNLDLDPKTSLLSRHVVICFILSIFQQHWGLAKGFSNFWKVMIIQCGERLR